MRRRKRGGVKEWAELFGSYQHDGTSWHPEPRLFNSPEENSLSLFHHFQTKFRLNSGLSSSHVIADYDALQGGAL